MNRKTSLIVLMIVALALAGCQAGLSTPQPDRKTPIFGTYDAAMLTGVPEETPTPESSPEPPQGVLAAQVALANRLDLPLESISIYRYESAQWPDECLGLGQPGETCAQTVVPGYSMVFQAGDQFYEYRTDETGGIIRPVDATLGYPAGAEAARQALADLISIQAGDIQVDDVQSIAWPDSCLGIPAADAVCAQMVVPGYRVLLTANGVSYEFHTNQDGSQVSLATILEVPIGQPYIKVVGQADQADCQFVQVGSNGVAFGACGSTLTNRQFSNADRPMELSDLVSRYAAFQAEAPAGSVTFNGQGIEEVTPEQQRAIVAWAQLAALEAAGEDDAENPGLVLRWTRSGGFAGLCDRLEIYESGWAYTRPCSDQGGEAVSRVFLTGENLQTLYNWVDTYSAKEFTASDGVVDGFQYDLSFWGGGSEQVPESLQSELNQYAQDIFSAFTP
jgi:hypothetical protein